jgi:predicted  nucleic acid-binding Zn-ribbon protein
VNPDLRKLIALQDIDLKIAVLYKQVSEIPLKISELEAAQQRVQSSYEEKAALTKNLGERRRLLEGEVDLARTRLSRLKEQLMAVKTNKEYTAMLNEIKGVEKQIQSAEDTILEVMEEMENGEKDLKLAEKAMREECAAIQDGIDKSKASAPALEDELRQLREEQSGIESQLNRELMAQYRRLAGAHKGVALAEAKDELCSVCHVRIRPQMYADLMRTETIRFCDSCSRILFYREQPEQSAPSEPLGQIS